MPVKAITHSERMNEHRLRPKDDRLSAGRRGYGAKWRKVRARHLSIEPLCRECRASGYVMPAKVVDHILPLRQGGTNADENLQSLCIPHHNKKTGSEKAAT